MSRLREKPERLFEVFVEVAKPITAQQDPFVIQQYPDDYSDKEALVMIPKFAYPCETDSSKVDHFTFVLTDLEGKFRFGYCRHATGHQTCLCILSWLPWCEIFYKMLDNLADILNRSENNSVTPFLKATIAHEIPVPKVPVTIVANEDMFSFTSPDPNVRPSIPSNRNLTEYYNAMDTMNMMHIFASMLYERRIYMTSKKLSRLTACIHAAEALLYPMYWQHLFIPVLPAHLIDYISAPMPYLIGVHKNLVEKLQINRVDVADAVVVDLDTNTVLSEYEDLNNMPEDIVDYLKKQLKPDRLRITMVTDGDAISKAFLHALVRLIGGYRDALKFRTGEPVTFDPEAFVQTGHNQAVQNFLEEMLALQLFQQFIFGKLEKLSAGIGSNDVFDQQVMSYAGKKSSQDNLLKLMKKRGVKGKEVLNGFRTKVKSQGKHAVATIKKQIAAATETDKRFSVSGGLVHSKHKGRPKSITEQKHATRPPRPPPPASRQTIHSTSPRSKTIMDDGRDSQDDSQLRLSYHKVDVSLIDDAEIQAAMNRSASAEVLPRPEDYSGSSSTLSSDAYDADSASMPFSSLHNSDEDETILRDAEAGQEETSAPVIEDKLIVQRPRSNMPTNNNPALLPPPVAPPRKRRSNQNSPAQSPKLQHTQAVPRPQIRRSLTLEGKPDLSKIVQETPLIQFESTESENGNIDIFDPLSENKNVKKDADDDVDFSDFQLRNVDRNSSSRSSLTRSKAFRRETLATPQRSASFVEDNDDDEDNNHFSDDDPSATDNDFLDDLAGLDLTAPASTQSSVSGSDRPRSNSDLMRHEWSLASLAPGPSVTIPLGTPNPKAFFPQPGSHHIYPPSPRFTLTNNQPQTKQAFYMGQHKSVDFTPMTPLALRPFVAVTSSQTALVAQRIPTDNAPERSVSSMVIQQPSSSAVFSQTQVAPGQSTNPFRPSSMTPTSVSSSTNPFIQTSIPAPFTPSFSLQPAPSSSQKARISSRLPQWPPAMPVQKTWASGTNTRSLYAAPPPSAPSYSTTTSARQVSDSKLDPFGDLLDIKLANVQQQPPS